MSDIEYESVPAQAPAPFVPQVPNGANEPQLMVDQSRGGMGGLIEVPGNQLQANPDWESVRDPNTNQSFMQEKQRPAYDPDKMFAAYPPAAREAMSNITDAGIGAWHHLAQFTALPLAGLLNSANETAKNFGSKGFLPNGGWTNDDAIRFVQKTMANAGIDSDPRTAYQRWAANMGESAADMATQAMMFFAGAGGAAKTGGAITAAAPDEAASNAALRMARMSPDAADIPTALAAKAASEAKQAVGSTMENVGNAAITYPGQVAASYLGSGIGAGAGQSLGQKDSGFQKLMQSLGVNLSPEEWSTIMSIGGGMFGSNTGSMRRIRPKDATDYEGDLGAGGFRGLPVSGGSQVRSLIDAPALLNAQREFSGEDVANAVNGYTQQVTNWLKNAGANVVGLKPNEDGSMPTLPSTARQAEQLKQTFLNGYNKAQQIAQNIFWDGVDKTPRATIPQAIAKARELATSQDTPEVVAQTIPMGFVKDVLALGGKNGLGMPNIGQMNNLVSAMRREATGLSVGDPSNTARYRVMRSNLIDLANSLDEDMGNANPSDAALAQARAYSNWVHQTFTNGPLGTFTNAMNSQPLTQMNPKDALISAMGDYRFGQQATGQTPQQLGPQAASGMNGMADLGEPIEPRTGDWLKSMVADTFNQKLDPNATEPLANAAQATAAAQRYMKSEDFQNLVKNFPALDQEMQGHFNNLQSGAAEAQSIGRSVFFKNAGMQPETAVDSLFNSGTKIKDAKKIVNQFNDNPAVMESMQYALVRKLGNTSNWDPSKMKTMLNSKDNRQLFQTLMPNGGFERLNHIIQGTIDASTQTTSIFGKYGPGRLLGRAMGTITTGWLGGHSIQIHSIGTNLGGNIVQRLFHIVPPEYMIGKALVDARWERFLNSQLPTTMSGIRQTNRMLGALVGAQSAANRRMMETAFPNGDDNGTGQ